MRPSKCLLAFVVIILLYALSSDATIVEVLDLDRLTANATLIIVGEITSVREAGKTIVQVGDRTVSARRMIAELRVDHVLKGQSPSPSSLRFNFDLPDEFVGWRSISPSYRIFFLAGSPGELKLANAYYPSAVATPGTIAQGATPIERVIDELREVLASTKSSSEEKREAIFALGATASPAAIFALARVGEIKDVTPIRLSIAAALLVRNDLSTLEFAIDALLKPDPALSPDVLHNVSYAISEGVKDKSAVPSLARLLHASNTEFRRAAASALMHVSSSTCIDPLLSALDDPDLEVRYYSVVGLAEITGQTEEWRPNMDDFLSNQQRYTNHWTDWARNR